MGLKPYKNELIDTLIAGATVAHIDLVLHTPTGIVIGTPFEPNETDNPSFFPFYKPFFDKRMKDQENISDEEKAGFSVRAVFLKDVQTFIGNKTINSNYLTVFLDDVSAVTMSGDVRLDEN